MTRSQIITLTDIELLTETTRVVGRERGTTAELLELLAEVETRKLVATLDPQPDVPSTVRKIPALAAERPMLPVSDAGPELKLDAQPREPSAIPQTSSGPTVQQAPFRHSHARAVVAPLAPERYLVKITIGREAHDKLERARDLLRHSIPNGDPAAIVERALTVLIEQLEKTKLAVVTRPRARKTASARRTRHIPAAIKRDVWARDEGRCAFVGTHGRCTETGFVQVHHLVPFAAEGPTTIENLELRCRAHNVFEAELFFGRSEPPESPGAQSAEPISALAGQS